MDVRLDDRTAIITGGSLGLGRAMALEFARSGAQVAIFGRTASTLNEATGVIEAEVPGASIAAFTCDVADAEQLTAAHRAAVEQFGPVDIVVNNAGTSSAKPFELLTDDDWYRDLELKLMAAVRLIRLCLPAMKEQRWGRIINVLNVAAKAPSANSTPTSVSRAAGMAMTKALAAEVAPFGILCNALNTGLLRTNQWHRMHAEQAPEVGFDEFLSRRTRGVPLGRIGDPAEFANLACFLASDRASFVTGTAINVDGGLSPVV
jgi:3-oxoacyl-[acyl-carrier protein] reductase